MWNMFEDRIGYVMYVVRGKLRGELFGNRMGKVVCSECGGVIVVKEWFLIGWGDGVRELREWKLVERLDRRVKMEVKEERG